MKWAGWGVGVDENKRGYQAWWQAELIEHLMDRMYFLAGQETGARDILIVRSLGNSPSEMPAHDDATSPHQGPGSGELWLTTEVARVSG